MDVLLEQVRAQLRQLGVEDVPDSFIYQVIEEEGLSVAPPKQINNRYDDDGDDDGVYDDEDDDDHIAEIVPRPVKKKAGARRAGSAPRSRPRTPRKEASSPLYPPQHKLNTTRPSSARPTVRTSTERPLSAPRQKPRPQSAMPMPSPRDRIASPRMMGRSLNSTTARNVAYIRPQFEAPTPRKSSDPIAVRQKYEEFRAKQAQKTEK
eukprot:GFYU01013931.1.p1 GENE.GFYU01013931.1~~GFYU01013931.1.p1  ORF type:complete len:207 (-),score=38.89 GFYU01013931.1:47-667(-)